MANLLQFVIRLKWEASLNILHVKLPAPKKIKTDKDKQT
jgi:hypothetical protein